MAEDRDEHAAFLWLHRPEERLRCTVFHAGRELANLAAIADELPVALVNELDLVEVSADRMPTAGLEAEFERAMPELGTAPLPGQADSLGEARSVLAAVHRIVEIDQS